MLTQHTRAHGSSIYNDKRLSHVIIFLGSFLNLKAVRIYVSMNFRNDEQACDWDSCNAIKGHWAPGHMPFCFEDPLVLDLKHHWQQRVLIHKPLFLAGGDEFVCILGCCLVTHEMFTYYYMCTLVCNHLRVRSTTEVRSWVNKDVHAFSEPHPSH